MTDSDGLSASIERQVNVSENSNDLDQDGIPNDVDTDRDGDFILNDVETSLGFNPDDPSDGAADNDSDSYTNAEEINGNGDYDDPAVVPLGGGGIIELQSNNNSVSEDAGSVSIPVHRLLGAVGTVSIDYSVTGIGNAIAGVDFDAVSGTLTWGPGEVGTKYFDVPIIADDDVEGVESARITLSNPVGAGTGMTEALISIYHDEWEADGSPFGGCLLYTSPSPRDKRQSRMPSSA